MSHGDFSGDPRTLWVTDNGVEDRRMRLEEAFWFRDPDQTVWDAAEGAVVDGASIPRALWSVVGSPFTGDYRRASIVHDVACAAAGHDAALRRAADRMFFHGCRAGGCSVWQAILLYIGVRIGAAVHLVPAWHVAVAADSTGPRLRRTDADIQLERDFQHIADAVLAPGETDDVAEVERRTDAAIDVIAVG